MDGRHPPALCWECATKLCTRALHEFVTPKCPLCRRKILFDCLLSFGWVEQSKQLVERHFASMRLVEIDFRVREGLSEFDVLTAEQVRALSILKRPVILSTTAIGFVFLHLAMERMPPGPIVETQRLDDDSLWSPENTNVFYTVALDFSRHSHFVTVWNGEHHGTCIRVGADAQGPYMIKAVLPYYSRERIMARRHTLANLEGQMNGGVLTRTRVQQCRQNMHYFFLEKKAEMYRSFEILAPDLM